MAGAEAMFFSHKESGGMKKRQNVGKNQQKVMKKTYVCMAKYH